MAALRFLYLIFDRLLNSLTPLAAHRHPNTSYGSGSTRPG